MMKNFLLLLLISIQLIWAEEQWVWNKKVSEDIDSSKGPITFNNEKNTNDFIQTIDNIVLMGRSGRKIPGFDSLYDDPDILQAIGSNNETYARSAIAERICSLKLTQCDQDIARHFGSGKPNFFANVVLGQPVQLNSVGNPIPVIPIKSNSYLQNNVYNKIKQSAFYSPQHYSSQGNPYPKFTQTFTQQQRPVIPISTGYGTNKVQHVHQHVHYHNEGNLNNGVLSSVVKPIYEEADFSQSNYYKNSYENDCDCVPLYQCDEEYIRRNSNQYHLAIDPRAPNIDIDIGNSSDVEISSKKSRKRRDVEDSKNDAETRSFSEKSFNTPITRSCQNEYICCPNRNARKFENRQRCGIRNILPITGRIKNDDVYSGDSDYGEYPWQVAILKNENNGQVYVSGGVLIDDRHVLTSAHNLVEAKVLVKNLILRLGEYDVTTEDEQYKHLDVNAASVVIHPKFNKVNLQNDIAIITLNQKINFGQNIHITPACMPSPYTSYVGQRCWTAGWGKDDQKNGHYQTILKEVDLPIVDSNTCENLLQRERLGANFKLHDGFICAGGEEGKDACKGDGGSPLVCQASDNTMQVVGIVSWGLDCGRSGVPGVYTKVSHYLDWIKSNIQNY